MAKKKEQVVEETPIDETPQTAPETVTLTDADKANFYKSFIMDTPFEAEDLILDGGLKLTFRALTSKQSLDVYSFLKEEQSAGLLTNDINYMSKVTIYRLVQALIKVNDLEFMPGKSVQEKAEVAVSWPSFKLSAYCDAFRVFEDKIVALTKEVTTENFWLAAKQFS